MTKNEFINTVSDYFRLRIISADHYLEVKEFSTKLAKENWPEVDSVDVSTAENGVDIKLHLVHKSDKDMIFWKLKYD